MLGPCVLCRDGQGKLILLVFTREKAFVGKPDCIFKARARRESVFYSILGTIIQEKSSE